MNCLEEVFRGTRRGWARNTGSENSWTLCMELWRNKKWIQIGTLMSYEVTFWMVERKRENRTERSGYLAWKWFSTHIPHISTAPGCVLGCSETLLLYGHVDISSKEGKLVFKESHNLKGKHLFGTENDLSAEFKNSNYSRNLWMTLQALPKNKNKSHPPKCTPLVPNWIKI